MLKASITTLTTFVMNAHEPDQDTREYTRYTEKSLQNAGKTIININYYIRQYGKANVIGDGSMQYKGSKNSMVQEVENLKSENRMLSEMIEILKLRDK